MDHQSTTLPAGVRVVTEPVDDVRSAAVGLWIGVGSRDEQPDRSGCSHFLEHLLFKGTGSRSARDIAEAFDAVGGEANAFTSKELTCFHARVLDRDLPLAVEVLSDMLRDAANAADDVEAERQVVLEEINVHLDSPAQLAHSDFAEVVLGGHPLARETLGTVGSVTGLDRDTVDRWYRRWYRPANVLVTAAGNLDHARVRDLVAEHLGDLGRGGGHRPERTPPAGGGHGGVSVRHRPTEQAHVVLGGPGVALDDPRRHPLRVLNTLLGGGTSSRLFQEVRERRGLAYATYSYAASYSDGGYHAAYAGTAPARVDELCGVIADELDRLPGSITAGEVERAKGNLLGSTVLSLEDTGSRMVRLGRLAVSPEELLTIEESMGRIEAVDVDDVRSVAADLLARPRSLAVVGPFDEDEPERFAAHLR